MAHKNEPAKEIYVFKIKQPDIVSGCSYIILVLKTRYECIGEYKLLFANSKFYSDILAIV